MGNTKYFINKVDKLFEERKDDEAIALFEEMAEKIVFEIKRGQITQKEVFELFIPIYGKIMELNEENRVPIWVVDYIIEAVDMHVSGKPLDIEAMEIILNKSQHSI
jgi:hypothetical protein